MEDFISDFERSRDYCLVDSALGTWDAGKLTWELTIPPEGDGSMCDERCEHCQCKDKSEDKSEEVASKPSALVLELAEDFGLPINHES